MLPINVVVYNVPSQPKLIDDSSCNGFRTYMHSALIPSEHGYPAITLGRITGTPEVRITRSSRTKEILTSIIVRPHQIETELSHDVLNPAHVPF